ncbi:MAG: hypothetical protein H6797_00660 [Candidatus Nomurabacteria bacterium]|nr:MAG: hypothetical protein H6797_00660 [Candidatus Nomurabacteria bacterium]
MAYPLNLYGTDRYAPIEWTSDSIIVEKILTFCEYEVASIRRKMRESHSALVQMDLEARLAILERIYGNLRNVNRLAYPAEISFQTVASDLTKNFGYSDGAQAKKASYLAALEHEWTRLRDHFKKHFIKPRLDW